MSAWIGSIKDYFVRLINGPEGEFIEDGQPEGGWHEGEPRGGTYRDEYAPPHYEDELRFKEKRPVTARQAQNNKVLEMYARGTGTTTEVVIRHPADVSEAAKVCDFIKEDKVCVVDLTGMERNTAQRIADFLGGACYALNGCVQRISKDIFIIAPVGVLISGDVKDELEKDGYVIPKALGHR